VVCGHIHVPAIRRIEGIDYYNCGDWVEHCTALVEHLDGRLDLVGPAGGAGHRTAAPRLDGEREPAWTGPMSGRTADFTGRARPAAGGAVVSGAR
jgi:hypothetical protein